MCVSQKLSYFSLIAAGVLASASQPALAGFEWVAPSSPKTAQVDAVEQAVLPPQAGVATGEPGTVPIVAAPVAPSGASVGGNGGRAPVYVPRHRTAVPQNTVPTVSVAPEPVMVTEQPKAAAPRDLGLDAPAYVYPPRGNVSARPLGAPQQPAGAMKPVYEPRNVSMPDESPATFVPTAPVAPVMSAPDIVPTVQVKAPSTPTPIAASAPAVPQAVIEGFGTGVPLSLALEQIIPDGWSVEDQAHLDPNTIVSWAGGRPWDKVLEDMLYAHGVRVSVTGSTVVLFRSGMAAPAPAVAVPVAAPVTTVMPTPVPTTPMATSPLPERVVQDVRVVPAAPAGTGPAVTQSQQNGASTPVVTSGRFDAGMVDLFSGRTGETVETVLGRWGRLAHVDIRWEVGADLTLPQSFAVNAPFSRAVERLLNMYREDPMRPVATLETDPVTGGAVLRVNRAR